MSQFTVSAIGWLETILEERFGHVFSLTSQTDTLQMSLPGSDEVINFDQLQGIFHESRSDFSCHKWQASKEGYRLSVEDSIPAPLEKQLPSPLIRTLYDRYTEFENRIFGIFQYETVKK